MPCDKRSQALNIHYKIFCLDKGDQQILKGGSVSFLVFYGPAGFLQIKIQRMFLNEVSPLPEPIIRIPSLLILGFCS